MTTRPDYHAALIARGWPMRTFSALALTSSSHLSVNVVEEVIIIAQGDQTERGNSMSVMT